jgi:two-component system, NarL family, sensor kinase
VPGRRRPSSELVRFGAAGLGAVVLLTGMVLVLLARISTSESLRSAEARARLAGYGIIEPLLDDGLLSGDQTARNRLDDLVQTRVLSEEVLRVKIWSLDGRIVYSDEPALLNQRFTPKADHAEAVRTGEVHSELATPNGPENAYERNSGRLLEVYLPVRATNGTPLVYEHYEQYDSVIGNSRDLLRRFALPMLGCVALLWLIQLPLARRLIAQVRSAEQERAVLAERAVSASAAERQRIAADLHDGVVQDLAGLQFELQALAQRTPEGPSHDALQRSATIARSSLKRVRDALLDLHPPTVELLGLRVAFEQIAAPIQQNTTVDIAIDPADETTVSLATQSILLRIGSELLRNVQEHAAATHARVAIVTDDDRITMIVSDNGRGFTAQDRTERRREGHVGLELHEALARQHGGTMHVDSRPGLGTTVTVELPR